MKKITKIWQLILTFLKIGAFTFGGGYAMISLIEKDVVENKKWLTSKEFTDIIAIAETTPGVIALNSATFIGAKIAGFWGALASSIAVILPSFIIIIILSFFIEPFLANKYIKYAFMGIKSCVVALIFNALFKLGKNVEKNLFSYFIIEITLVLSILSSFNIIKIDVVIILLGVAVLGIFYGIFIASRSKNK